MSLSPSLLGTLANTAAAIVYRVNIMSDLAIKIENLKKKYRLGTIGGGTLSADIESWWARLRGREDPNLKIGTDNSRIGSEFYALKGISLEIKKGEVIGIIGSNGAGKSTLLKILSRVTAPTEGKIGINGRITGMLEVGTGFHPELTGRENIYMNGAILGMSKKEIDAKIEDIIDFSECREFIDTPVKRYSSGMYVKLGFSVASHLESEIMIMDEVLAVGDVKFQEKCLGSIKGSASNLNKTILYVSHNMATIRKICSRCIVLEHGSIVYDGDVDTAIGKYMDRSDSALRGYYDLNEVERPDSDHGRAVHIKSFEYINGDNGTFKDENIIKFRIEWDSYISNDLISMYIPLKYADSTPVGMAQSVPFKNGGFDSSNRMEFNFDVSNLVDGKYYFILDFNTVNEYGAHISYDHPNQNIYFEIVRSKENRIEWQRRYWGSVRLNDIYVGQ